MFRETPETGARSHEQDTITSREPIPSHAARLPKRTGLELSAEQREQLLDRLAQGAKNAELAQHFGLNARQVQGIRMGAAREIAKRRERVSVSEDNATISASPEDVVRYLRQQDDVVVPHAGGEFLVNGRFQLTLTELV